MRLPALTLAVLWLAAAPAAAGDFDKADPEDVKDVVDGLDCTYLSVDLMSVDLTRKFGERGLLCPDVQVGVVMKAKDGTTTQDKTFCQEKELDDKLLAQYADQLSAVDSPAARRAVEVLRRKGVELAVAGETHGKDRQSPTRPALRLSLPKEELSSVRSELAEASQDAEDKLASFAARTAHVIVHETAHERAQPAEGPAEIPFEEELLARGEEALFLRARLSADPRHVGLYDYDKAMTAAAGLEPRGNDWWKHPLSDEELSRVRARRAFVLDKKAKPFTATTSEAWLAVRGAAGGLAGVERALKEAGVTLPRGRLLAESWTRKAALEKTRARRALLTQCVKAAETEREKQPLKAELAAIGRRLDVLEDGKAVERWRAGLRAALADVEKDLALR